MDCTKSTQDYKINQLDGNASSISVNSSDDDTDSDDSTDYETEDEAFSQPIPANLVPIFGQVLNPGEPIKLDVNLKQNQSSSLPLCVLFNARSIFNKLKNLKEFLNQIGPDVCLISETFESERRRIDDTLNSRQYKSISYYRKHRAPGGGCAILYSENRFSVTNLKISAQQEIECCLALFVPKSQGDCKMKVKKIAIGLHQIQSSRLRS